MSACDLHGAAVLVTRPREQAAGLAGAVRRLGGTPVLLPGIEIEACDDEGALARGLDSTDLVIFVSPNAVRIGAPRIVAAGMLPDRARIAAIGSATAAALRELGLREVIVPASGQDSEALAACPELADVRGRSVLIVRGQGGRERLASVLSQRGANVRYAQCYRRIAPALPAPALATLWQSASIAAWTATSAEIVDNLFAMAGESAGSALRGTPLLVPHARIATRAFRHAVATIVVTAPGDDGIAAGLATWLCRLRPADLNRTDTDDRADTD